MKLDLHGIRHENVRQLLDSHIYRNEPPFEVVTGNSLRMKQIVIEVLKEYDLHYLDLHSASIIVLSEELWQD